MSYVEEPFLVEIGPKIDPVTKKPATLGKRQASRIAAGMHPLSGVGATPRLIRLAPSGTGTCGTCVHRQQVDLTVGADGYHRKAYTKCVIGAEIREGSGLCVYGPRVSNSEATDCRASWPACADYQPKGDS